MRLLGALEWIEPIPDNPDLALIFPYVEVLRNRARLLAEHHVLRLSFIGDPLASQVREAPPPNEGSHGRIDTCAFDRNHLLFVAGWAWLPEQNRRADCVVIGCQDVAGHFKPLTVLGTGGKRTDPRNNTHSPQDRSCRFFPGDKSGESAARRGEHRRLGD